MIDPLANPPAAVLALLSERTRYDGDGNRWFADEDGISPIIDIHEPGCPSAGPRAAARHLHSRRPDLWAAPKPAEKHVESAPAKSAEPPTPATVSGLMAAVRQGHLSLDAAHAAVSGFLNPRAAAPPPSSTSNLNFTQTMIAARGGDASAMARLDAALAPRGR